LPQDGTTTTGLAVHAEHLDDHDATSLRVSDAVLATLNLTAHNVCPFWNYTLRPRPDAFRASAMTPPKREVIPYLFQFFLSREKQKSRQVCPRARAAKAGIRTTTNK
jgi:hypothetical protein